jgi:molecular chaperone GrpE
MRKSTSRRKGKKKDRSGSGEKTARTEASAASGSAAGPASGQAGPASAEKRAGQHTRPPEPQAPDEKLREEKARLEDRLLRLAAEFDNYRKRNVREYQQVVETANRDLILQLIDVLDNFQRALDSAKSAKDFDAFHQGVELIYTHLHEILTRQGLEPIEAVGLPFDPHLHEAVMQIDDEQHPPDTVVDQMQPGYLLRDKLLRAPRVVVSRNPGEAETTAAPEKAKEDNGPSAEKDHVSKKPSSRGTG